ncbi:MAG TPA: SDR family NAD(P)-dependent oxidoreductase, partial [Spirochaetia bacterium]|nr:SDR family NAD(P)-dependent oxidoreductase [Spirochaetia bacterium]
MIQTLFDLRGKTALVTGSSRGLGLTLALGLGKAGASVVLNGRDSDRLKRAVSELKSQGLTVSGYTFDITNKADVTEKIHRIEKEVGALDILVNNAGVQ